MKNPLKLTLMLLALLLPATAIAHDFEVDGICYNIINENEVAVTYKGVSYYTANSYSGDVSIPTTVIYNGATFNVTSIDDGAFYCCSKLTNISIPNSITSIGDYAFTNCSKLTDVTSYIVDPSSVSTGNNIFSLTSGDYTNRKLLVPYGSKTAYQNITKWSHYFDSIEEIEHFVIDGLQYHITSENTVEVARCEYIDQFASLYEEAPTMYDITIPSHITFNNKDYTVTAIGDKAFYSDYDVPLPPNIDYSEYVSFNLGVTIPETVNRVGTMAFGGTTQLVYIVCLDTVPPFSNDSFSFDEYYSSRYPNPGLYVFANSYQLYELFNQENSIFATINVTNGERSERPEYEEKILFQDDAYGFFVRFTNNYNNIHLRTLGFCAGEYNSSGWTEYYESSYYYTAMSDRYHWIEFYAVEEGKSPSKTSLAGGYFRIPGSQSYDFDDSGIYYNIVNQNEVEVTYRCYYYGGWPDYFYYWDDIIIPNKATQIIYSNNTTSTYIVTKIGQNAFVDCEGLKSVTLPETITSVQDDAFYNCPSLTYIKCMSNIPPVASNQSFDDAVYRNATLYVPFGAEDAYRNADGWSNFLNIVGFSDIEFNLDGISYKVIGENAVIVISSEVAYSGNVVIPETVTVDGVTYAVTGIGSGAFANDSLNFLTIPVSVTGNIASDAFEGCSVPSAYIIGEGAWADGALPASVDTLYISSDVTGVEGLQVNPSVIYSYAALPPTCDGNSFTGYDAELHVPASSLAAYFTEPYWSNFINIVSDAVEPTGLSLENDSISIMVGNQITLMATVTPDNATPQQVFWASTNDSIAKIGPINGELTALKAGECDIMATLLDKTVVCHITVTEIAPAEVTISQEFAKLEIGSQLTLTATVLPEDATDKVITWTTTNSDVATVDSLGNVMAMGQGECFITATCRDKQAMCHVIVVEHFIYITLDEHRLSLLPNHMEWIAPTVTPVSTDLVVTSSNPSVAAARMANGRIQVVGITEGTTIIKVNSVDGYAEADSCRVTVRTQRGDVNYDGFINITDVTMMISQLMSAQGESYYDINADVNNDGEVNISDVTRLISHLMTGAELEPKDENQTFTVNGVTFKMIKVEGGTFMMGATEEEDADYQVFKGSPKHQVTLSDYFIGETEVTQELWLAVMGNNPSSNTGDLLRPVENVNWNDCDTFIMRLNALTGKEFRLPSEAEWEFAAHGGNLTQGYIYAGSDSIDEVAWYIANSDNVTHPVATKVPNELGLYDMNGNAEEWCNDWYYLYTEEPVTNPTGPETGRSRVHRGGRYSGAVKFCRITRRDGFSPGVRRTYMGLRLAM